MPPGGISGDESNLTYPCAARKIGAIGRHENRLIPSKYYGLTFFLHTVYVKRR